MNASWTGLAALVILAGLGLFPPAHALDVANRRASAKNRADDRIYFDHRITLYCRCQYVSDEGSDGSGTVDMGACGVTPLPEKKNTTKKIQWEHIVPASLTPARHLPCREDRRKFQECVEADGDLVSGRPRGRRGQDRPALLPFLPARTTAARSTRQSRLLRFGPDLLPATSRRRSSSRATRRR